ncbi:hypothetical protein KSP40_PGU017870 [Platanthera guangdongensis]|uniref:Uncharacterized protein n=1 Tax=Platanthera guangdongensis TaxID=2320717 RepID=A0ABR2LX47_9ASPA
MVSCCIPPYCLIAEPSLGGSSRQRKRKATPGETITNAINKMSESMEHATAAITKSSEALMVKFKSIFGLAVAGASGEGKRHFGIRGEEVGVETERIGTVSSLLRVQMDQQKGIDITNWKGNECGQGNQCSHQPWTSALRATCNRLQFKADRECPTSLGTRHPRASTPQVRRTRPSGGHFVLQLVISKCVISLFVDQLKKTINRPLQMHHLEDAGSSGTELMHSVHPTFWADILVLSSVLQSAQLTFDLREGDLIDLLGLWRVLYAATHEICSKLTTTMSEILCSKCLTLCSHLGEV